MTNAEDVVYVMPSGAEIYIDRGADGGDQSQVRYFSPQGFEDEEPMSYADWIRCSKRLRLSVWLDSGRTHYASEFSQADIDRIERAKAKRRRRAGRKG